MATTERITTAAELLRATSPGRCELVRGDLVMMTPLGFEHGRIAARVAVRLGTFVEEHRLGVVTGAETGFQIAQDPDTVRAPDVGFVRADRVAATPTRAFFQGPPDLAVEVLSPNDRAGELLAKVHDWLEAGCVAVWVVDPQAQTIAVYRARSPMLVYRSGDTIEEADLLPDFRLPVADVFALWPGA